jgi:23S rRNA pseudouridine1911/1915/1917 synthase
MIEIIYEDNFIIVINKPAGMVVFPESEEEIKIANRETYLSLLLLEKYPFLEGVGGSRNGAVHRLDKDTSGVLLFAKDEKTLSFLQNEILEQRTKKRYITLAWKIVKKDSEEIKTFIVRSPKDRRKQKADTSANGKREAITIYKVIKRFKNYTLLEVEIKTGRKHQIRCHLAFIGHPVVGDKLYCFKDQKDPPETKRQLLHSELLEIETPTGKKTFKANLPEDFKNIINNLK